MISKRAKWSVAIMSGLALALVLLSMLNGTLMKATAPLAEHEYFKVPPTARRLPLLVIAHRGGAGLWPENTMYAFERAVALGVDVLEMDVQQTADGVLVVMHDETLARTTDGHGLVRDRTLAELKKLDAAYRWSPDGGKSFPLRGRGITVPTLEEVLANFHDMRFNIEPKPPDPSVAKNLCRLIRERAMTNRVLIASFKSEALATTRQQCPEVATSASTAEVSKFMALSAARLEQTYTPAAYVLQVPEYAGGLHVLTRGLVEAAHQRNLKVDAWTVNEVEAMKRLLDLGVDGIMTDYPDRLLSLLAPPP